MEGESILFVTSFGVFQILFPTTLSIFTAAKFFHKVIYEKEERRGIELRPLRIHDDGVLNFEFSSCKWLRNVHIL